MAEQPDQKGRSSKIKRIRLLLLDDHILFREGFRRRLLVSEPGFETVAECGAQKEALEALSRSAVDLVLLDFDLEDDTGARFIASATAAACQERFYGEPGMTPLDISVPRKLGISGIF